MKRLTALSLVLAALLSPALQADESRASPRIMFKPPQRGAPATRVGGGTRGIGKQSTQIQLLASEQTGLTSQATPTLYWYASSTTPHDVEVTVRLDENEPLLEKNIGAIKTPGIQAIHLADYGVTLTPGKDYTWSVAVVTDPKQRSADLFASAVIRLQKPAALLTDVAQMAAAGYWYDTISQLVESKSPQLSELLQQEGISITTDK
jgi:hypothetical protein